MSLTKEELVLGERKFLHELSNHIVVAQGMGVIALKKLKSVESDGVDPSVLDKLEKSVIAIDKIIEAVKERREILHSQVKPT